MSKEELRERFRINTLEEFEVALEEVIKFYTRMVSSYRRLRALASKMGVGEGRGVRIEDLMVRTILERMSPSTGQISEEDKKRILERLSKDEG